MVDMDELVPRRPVEIPAGDRLFSYRPLGQVTGILFIVVLAFLTLDGLSLAGRKAPAVPAGAAALLSAGLGGLAGLCGATYRLAGLPIGALAGAAILAPIRLLASSLGQQSPLLLVAGSWVFGALFAMALYVVAERELDRRFGFLKRAEDAPPDPPPGDTRSDRIQLPAGRMDHRLAAPPSVAEEG
jgi:hypothetical protein